MQPINNQDTTLYKQWPLSEAQRSLYVKNRCFDCDSRSSQHFDCVMMVFICGNCNNIHRASTWADTGSLYHDHYNVVKRLLLQCLDRNNDKATDIIKEVAPHFCGLRGEERFDFYFLQNFMGIFIPYIDRMYSFIISEAVKLKGGDDVVVKTLTEQLTKKQSWLHRHVITDNEKRYLTDPTTYYEELKYQRQQRKLQQQQEQELLQQRHDEEVMKEKVKQQCEFQQKLVIVTPFIVISAFIAKRLLLG